MEENAPGRAVALTGAKRPGANGTSRVLFLVLVGNVVRNKYYYYNIQYK